MVSFRKMSMAFAGCLLMGVSAANAALDCTVKIVDPVNLRAEALTQPIGDIVISCTIPAAWAAPVPPEALATIQVLSDGFQFTNLKNENDELQGVTLTVAGAAQATPKAVLASDGKSFSLTEVTVDDMVAANAGAETTRDIVISGLKVNSAALALLSSPKVRVQVITYAAAIAKLSIPSAEATQEIGTVLDGVSFSFKNKHSVACGGQVALVAADYDSDDERKALAYVTFTGGYPGALEVGDKLKARFNVPTGSKLFVATASLTSAGAWVDNVDLDDAAEDPFVEIKAVDGVYEATWEITAVPADKTYRIPVYLVVPTNSPANSTLTATGSLGPWSDVATSTTDEDVADPRFVEPTEYTEAIYEIGSCNTTILFPYATNVGNWDTGIAITNPTADMKKPDDKWASGSKTEKTGQTGACTLYFVGENGTEKGVKTTKNLAAGKTLAFTVGQGSEEYGIAGLPGFNGYVKVSCDFSNGKGFAFMSSSDLGGVGVGYVAGDIASLVP